MGCSVASFWYIVNVLKTLSSAGAKTLVDSCRVSLCVPHSRLRANQTLVRLTRARFAQTLLNGGLCVALLKDYFEARKKGESLTRSLSKLAECGTAQRKLGTHDTGTRDDFGSSRS